MPLPPGNGSLHKVGRVGWQLFDRRQTPEPVGLAARKGVRIVLEALDRLLHGRTSIIIAHRLATVRRADEILVVEHGRIVQRGTERELLAEDGPFRRLARDLRGPVSASELARPL